MIIETQKVDLLISHSQILVRSRSYSEELSQWGDINIEQRAIIHPDYVIFDPLPDEAFGANVILSLADDFKIDERSARVILVPFTVEEKEKLEVASAFQGYKIKLNLDKKKYKLYFEICEGDEVFYKFTFVASDEEIVPIYLMDDNWGGEKGKELVLGYK